jgi:hypothetical protein
MSIILGWDPARGAHVLPQFRSAAAQIQAEGRGSMPWPVAPHSRLEYGTRVHLMLQGAQRGIVGLGTVRSAPFLSFTGTQNGPMSQYVMISWRALLPEEDRIGTLELAARVPDIDWDRLYAPELALSPEDSFRLDRVWLAPHPSAGAGAARRAASRLIDEPVPSGDQGRWSRSAAAL